MDAYIFSIEDLEILFIDRMSYINLLINYIKLLPSSFLDMFAVAIKDAM